MAKKVKKYQPGGPTFPASASRFMDVPAKPKPAPAPVKKETKQKSKKSTDTSSNVDYMPSYNQSNRYKKIESIDPYKYKRKLMTYPEAMTAMGQKEIDDFKASRANKKKKGGSVKKKK